VLFFCAVYYNLPHQYKILAQSNLMSQNIVVYYILCIAHKKERGITMANTYTIFNSAFTAINWTYDTEIQNCRIFHSPDNNFVAVMIPWTYANTPLAHVCVMAVDEYAKLMSLWNAYVKKHNGVIVAATPLRFENKVNKKFYCNDMSIGELRGFLKRFAETD
jgi:hypothetical protein